MYHIIDNTYGYDKTNFTVNANQVKSTECVYASYSILEVIINNDADNRFELRFSRQLTAPEITAINAIIAGCDKNDEEELKNTSSAVANTYSLVHKLESVLSKTYKAIGTFYYYGSNCLKLSKVIFLSFSAQPYYVKIYDVLNKKTIAEKRFTNTAQALNNINTFTNVPTSESIFEVQVMSDYSVATTVTITNFNIITY